LGRDNKRNSVIQPQKPASQNWTDIWEKEDREADLK